jgi:hypothetical protein
MARYSSQFAVAALLLALAYVAQGFVAGPHTANVATVRRTAAHRLSMSTAAPSRTEPYIAEPEQHKPRSRVMFIQDHDSFFQAMAKNADRPVVIKVSQCITFFCSNCLLASL